MKATDKRIIIVGLFIFVGLMFFIAGILAIGKLKKSFTKKIQVTSVFDDVSGLQQGNNIWFSGVKIGIVKDLSFSGTSQVEVIMNIEQKAQPYIHKNAMAKISSDGLIGNRIIVIYGGTPDVPIIEDGDKLGVEKTFSSDDMIKTLQENNVNFLAISADLKGIIKKIDNGEGTIGALLNNDTLYRNLELITASLRKASENIGKVTANLSAYSSKLQQPGTLANDLVTDTTVFSSMKATAKELNEIASTANEVVTSLKNASTDTNSPLGLLLQDKETASSLKTTIKNLETSSQKLDEDLEALQHSFLLRGYFKKEAKNGSEVK